MLASKGARHAVVATFMKFYQLWPGLGYET